MIYLGTIDNAGSDVKNNKNTSTPFQIPNGATALRLVPSAATMLIATKLDEDTSFAPAAGAMCPLGTVSTFIDIPLSNYSRPIPLTLLTLAVRKTDAGAGTTKVFAI